jgi:3-phenylpropionate/trans-cinnamate dioxygenase ferredoxin reductase subunit
LRLGQPVVCVDPDGHDVTLADGCRLGYGSLIWAAGGRPRRLTCAGHDLHRVHTLRTRADADAMMVELPSVSRVVVIGGGYIGLETASVLSKLGKQVTVLETRDRVLERVTGESLSRFYEAEHRAHGVDVRLGTTVESIEGRDNSVSGVRLADGTVLPADMVIVGVGILPAVGPLITAGALGDNGVAVDNRCRTSLPDIYAIGDCAFHPNAYAGDDGIRLESVQNAIDQASTVAKLLTGADEPYQEAPRFWSNQYDIHLQTIGLSAGHDSCVVRGDPAARSFSVIYLKNGRVVALDCVNATRDYVHGRTLVVNGISVPAAERLADVSVPLKQLIGI